MIEKRINLNGKELDLDGGGLLLTADIEVSKAYGSPELILRTEDASDGLSARMLNDLRQSGQKVTVPTPSGSYSVIGRHGRSMSVNSSYGVVMGTVTGVIITGDGNVVHGGSHQAEATSGITAEIRLPDLGILGVDGHNTKVKVFGDGVLEEINATGHNGSLDILTEVRALYSTGHNKSVYAAKVNGRAVVQTHNGSADLVIDGPGRVSYSGHNGNLVLRDPKGLEAAGQLSVSFRSHNGRRISR